MMWEKWPLALSWPEATNVRPSAETDPSAPHQVYHVSPEPTELLAQKQCCSAEPRADRFLPQACTSYFPYPRDKGGQALKVKRKNTSLE